MSDNIAKYEVLIKQYLHSILDISEILRTKSVSGPVLHIAGSDHSFCSMSWLKVFVLTLSHLRF